MATTISGGVGLIIFIVVILVCAIFAAIVKPDYFKSSRVSVFLMALAGLSVVVIFLFYFALLQVNQRQINLATVQETSTINRSIFSFSENLKSAAATNPDLVRSILPLMPCPDGDVAKCTDRTVLAYQVFSVWNETLAAKGFADLDPLAYTTAFLQRAHSRDLYSEWQLQKINFRSETQRFGDLLFRYGLTIDPQIPGAYVRGAEDLLDNPEYRKLIGLGYCGVKQWQDCSDCCC